MRGWEPRAAGRHYTMRGKAGAERAGTIAESAPAVAIPRASHDIGDVLHISHVTYVKI